MYALYLDKWLIKFAYRSVLKREQIEIPSFKIRELSFIVYLKNGGHKTRQPQLLLEYVAFFIHIKKFTINLTFYTKFF